MSSKQPIYLVIGVPGSGKSWCCEQLTDKFEYVHHDGFIYLKQPGAYLRAVLEKAAVATKPLLIEAPFSVSETVGPLEAAGYTVKQIFIIEPPEVVSMRYLKREGKYIPKGHLTRMNTYAERAKAFGTFAGPSTNVLEFLKAV